MTTLRTTDEIFSNLISLHRTGGTVPVIVGVRVPDSGYVVSHKDRGLEVGRFERRGSEVKAWIDREKNRAAFDGDFLGIWEDSETLTTYFDVSRVFPERAVAEQFARDNDQIAFWSLTDNEEIRL